MTALSKELGTLDASLFIAAKGMRKSFGGAQALKDASLSILPGEVHGLVGANGAGKSTFIRILAGLVQSDAGEILLDGKPFVAASAHYAAEAGLSFIHQELALVPDMTVIENIMLGLPKRTRFGWVDWTATAHEAVPIARRVGVTAPLDAKVKGLSTAENWLISITRALIRKSRLIVMDEPTAALSVAESDRLFEIVRALRSSGVAVLYVSHRLDEVLHLCQRVTVFRDGRSVAELAGDGLNRRALVEAIIGREPATERAVRAPAARPGLKILSVRNLSRPPKVNDISFDLREGEVLGLGGLVGAGRSELARLIFGTDRLEGGVMTLAGRAFRPRDCSDAVKAGVGLVPEERRAEGLVLTKSVAFNVGLANLGSLVFSPWLPFLSRGRRRSLAETMVRDLSIKTPDIETPVGKLSGGNQQKVLIGRWLGLAPRVLILDEPTRGVDIGARGEIHRLVRELARGGMAVLVISSEPEELPELCDRVLVMASGRIVGELSGRAMTRHGIIAASYGEGGEKGPRMREMSLSSHRLSPSAKAALGVFARYATVLGLMAMIACFSVLSPDAFPTFNNFVNVLNQASLAMIIAGGLTLAVIVGELDLSIGYAASLHGVLVTGLIVQTKLPVPVAILIVLLLGALIGVVNGLIVTKLRVNSVIATLGVGTIIVGLSFAYSAGVPIAAGVPDAFLDLALGRWLFGVPNPIIVMALVLGALWSSGGAHRGRPGNSGRRRQSRGRPPCRDRRRPHQDHRLRHLRSLRRAHRNPARVAPG